MPHLNGQGIASSCTTGAVDVQTQQNPPVPSVHADAMTAPPDQSLRPPRRRPASPPSPAKTPDARSKKRSPNYVHTQAASPAVISSLIDQLSAISLPAHAHFENLIVDYNNGLAPPSAKSSIHTASGRNSTAGHDGSSIDHSIYNHSLREQNDGFPDDACEPPVIRTAKPPSGYSALTAPKKKDKLHSLGSYIRRSSGSSASLHSTHSNQSVVSIGNISIEAGVPKPSSGGSARSSAESKRSGKVHRGLMYMSSRERLRQKETKRHTTQSSEDVMSHDSPRKGSVPLFPYEDTIKEEPTSRDEDRPFQAESSRFAQRYLDRSNSPRRLRINLVDSPDDESATNPCPIPERGSSLKHTRSPTRKSRESRTSGTNRQEQQQPDPVAEGPKKLDEELVLKEKILQELEEEENEVAQRIRELKEQKLRRDRIAGKQVINGDAGVAASSVPQVSLIPSPGDSPTSVVSSVSERLVQMQDPTKAHKILGITREEVATGKPGETERLVEKTGVRKPAPAPIAILKTQALRHLTFKDGEDTPPLPINYYLAVQKAEEISPPTPTVEAQRPRSPPPPSISVASSKETTSVTSPRRSSSAATVGGRSAIGRKATPSLMGTTKGHQHSSSVTDGSTLSLKPASLRSASADIGVRHHSMIMPLPDSNSLQLQRKRTLTKKRWSHPDLPAKAEKRHNDKVERMEQEAAAHGVGAVQRPSRAIFEERIDERPASVDSIDLEVDSYLNSSRLSQKIRHPQTGRVISFSEVGDPNGFAVFVCVGMGLTRYVMAFYDQLAATLKLRLITPDRPGIGGSQIDPTGTPLSWPGEYTNESALHLRS